MRRPARRFGRLTAGIAVIGLAGVYMLSSRYLLDPAVQTAAPVSPSSNGQVSDADAKKILGQLKNIPQLDEVYMTTDNKNNVLVAATAILDNVQEDPVTAAETIAARYTAAVYRSGAPVGNAMIICSFHGKPVFGSALGAQQAGSRTVQAFRGDGSGPAFVQYLKEYGHENPRDMENDTWVEIGAVSP
jgi:hypothetical protein